MKYLLPYFPQAGLYEEWMEDSLEHARRESRAIQKMKQNEKREALGMLTESVKEKPLTIVHTQGPFILLLLGLIIAWFTFTVEMLILWSYPTQL